MKTPFEIFISLTYTRAGRRGRRKDRFMSFISAMSVTSIALGVAALIIVLSVMNGFQKEVRDRMLSVVPHIEVMGPRGALNDWHPLADAVLQVPGVVSAAPYVTGQGLLSSGRTVRGAVVKGIDPSAEGAVSDLASQLRGGAELSVLEPGSFRVILGRDLANALRVRPGDKVALLVPEGNMTPTGLVPRMKQFTVAALFQSGHYEYDSSMAVVHVDDAAALFRTGGPQGLRVKTSDMNEAPVIAQRLLSVLPSGFWAVDWSRQNRTWFAAVQVEKPLRRR